MKNDDVTDQKNELEELNNKYLGATAAGILFPWLAKVSFVNAGFSMFRSGVAKILGSYGMPVLVATAAVAAAPACYRFFQSDGIDNRRYLKRAGLAGLVIGASCALASPENFLKKLLYAGCATGGTMAYGAIGRVMNTFINKGEVVFPITQSNLVSVLNEARQAYRHELPEGLTLPKLQQGRALFPTYLVKIYDNPRSPNHTNHIYDVDKSLAC